MSVDEDETVAIGSRAGVRIDELACDLEDCLMALPYDRYRRLLRAMFEELVEFHRAELDDAVMPLVVETIAAVDPAAAVSAAALADLEARWAGPLEGFPGRTYNALALCRVLSRIPDDLGSGRRWVSGIVNNAIVGNDIRPQTPNEAALGPYVPEIANEDAPEIKMLRRFIGSALHGLDEAGIQRPVGRVRT